MSTEKVYETRGEVMELASRVTACQACEGGFAVALERTVFFPGGGGQAADGGELVCAATGAREPVKGLYEDGDEVWHCVAHELSPGTEVVCRIDADARRRRMQNHGGEHIVSGIVYRRYGFHNVGFHMGEDDMTIDFDGVLDRAALDSVEREANAAVTGNRTVRVSFPTPEVLAALDYRSKKALTGRVRIVEIDGMDRCACCAPHFEHTGCIGIIKILDFIHYKGGVRVHLLCGLDALEDYGRRYAATADISARLSVPQAEVAGAVAELAAEAGHLRGECGALRRQMLALRAGAIEATEGNICLFEPLDGADMRYFVNLCQNKCGGVCALFSGDDGAGYRYILASHSLDMRALAPGLNRALNGRGGGSAQMIQGSVSATRHEIENYISGL